MIVGAFLSPSPRTPSVSHFLAKRSVNHERAIEGGKKLGHTASVSISHIEWKELRFDRSFFPKMKLLSFLTFWSFYPFASFFAKQRGPSVVQYTYVEWHSHWHSCCDWNDGGIPVSIVHVASCFQPNQRIFFFPIPGMQHETVLGSPSPPKKSNLWKHVPSFSFPLPPPTARQTHNTPFPSTFLWGRVSWFFFFSPAGKLEAESISILTFPLFPPLFCVGVLCACDNARKPENPTPLFLYSLPHFHLLPTLLLATQRQYTPPNLSLLQN